MTSQMIMHALVYLVQKVEHCLQILLGMNLKTKYFHLVKEGY